MNRSKNIIFLVTLLLVVTIVTRSQIAEWDKLVMLQSTREEVEAILGKPEKYFETSGVYITEKGKFSAWYSDGECRSDKTNQYRVPRGIVTVITHRPKSKRPLVDYLGHSHDYTERRLAVMPDRIFWVSKDGAVSYETMKSGGQYVVFSIRLYPNDELHEKFTCESN